MWFQLKQHKWVARVQLRWPDRIKAQPKSGLSFTRLLKFTLDSMVDPKQAPQNGHWMWAWAWPNPTCSVVACV